MSEPSGKVPSLQRRPIRVAEAAAWFAVALMLRGAVAWLGDFDGYWGQDAWGYLDQARSIERALHGGPLPVSRWPQGYPALIVLLSKLGLGVRAAGQISSLLCGAATVPVVWLAGRAWWPETAPWGPRLAALFVLLSPVHVLWSACATSDAAATFWLALACWGLGRSGRARHPSAWMVLVGASLALAVSTRLASAVALPAVAVGVAWRLALGRQTVRGVSVAGLAFALALSPQLVMWSQAPASVAHPWLLGWRPWHAVMRSFDTMDGHGTYRWPQGVYAWFALIHPGYLGPAAAVLAAVAVRALWRARRPASGFLLSWVAVATLLFTGMPYQNFRFGLVALLPWALMAGAGATLLRRAPDRGRRLGPRAIGLALVVLTLAGQAVWAARLVPRHIASAKARTEAAERLGRILPPTAQVLAFGLTADLAWRNARPVVELAGEDATSLARRWPSDRLTFVVLDPDNVAEQWAHMPAGGNLQWLRKRAEFVLVDRVGRWWMWRLSPPPGAQRGSERPKAER